MTPNFSLDEFIRSDAASKLGDPNLPTPEHRANLRVAAMGLEWARSILGGKAIRITSGYRNPAVNAFVGGVANSDHAQGFAADITVAGMDAKAVAKALAASPLVFDQIILESSRSIVHLSFAPRMRRQVLTQPKGPGTQVFPGII